MRALFFGTPSFAVPSLDALCSIAEVVGVVCQPDKPSGRGLTLTPPPVKARALERGIPVVQPTNLRTGEFAEWVRAQRADVAVVVAYGRILPKDVLEAPRMGCVNVHASLLPKYRGAAPITWAVVNGETESGVTLMLLDEGMDTGGTIQFFKTPVGNSETSGELSERLAVIGADAVHTTLADFVAGRCAVTPQDNAAATMAPMLTKEDGRIDFSKSAEAVHNHVRGMNPWPCATARLNGKTVKIHRAQIASGNGAPGEVILADKGHLRVACGSSAIELETVQLEGKKPMRGVDWVIGRGVAVGDRFE